MVLADGVEPNDRTDNVCCVMSRKQSRRPASQRSEKCSVGWCFMPTPPRSQRQFCRVCWTHSRRSRASASHESESPPMERSGMMAGFGAIMAIRDSRPRSPATGSQTNIVLPAGSGSPSPRLLPVLGVRRSLAPYWQVEPAPTGPCAASRAIACPGRYAEHRGHIAGLGRAKPRDLWLLAFRGRARAVLTVSPVCGRRNEGA